MWQFSLQIAKSSAWRDDRPPVLFELGNFSGQQRNGFGIGGFCFAKQSGERAVNRVAGSNVVRVHGDANVPSTGPMLKSIGILYVCGCMKKSDLLQ